MTRICLFFNAVTVPLDANCQLKKCRRIESLIQRYRSTCTSTMTSDKAIVDTVELILRAPDQNWKLSRHAPEIPQSSTQRPGFGQVIILNTEADGTETAEGSIKTDF